MSNKLRVIWTTYIRTVPADHMLGAWVDYCINRVKHSTGDVVCIVSSQAQVDALRCAAKQGRISCWDITFQYDNRIYPIDKDGRFPEWPGVGFADIVDRHLDILLGESK